MLLTNASTALLETSRCSGSSCAALRSNHATTPTDRTETTKLFIRDTLVALSLLEAITVD